MRELLLQRRYFKDTYTIGKLSVDGVPFCDVLEDKTRDLNHDGDLNDEGEGKVYGETAIPFGRYRVIVSYSPKFNKRLPLLLDVPHFDGIRMHGGVHSGHTEGCLILGENKEKGKISNSKYYVDLLTSWIEMWQKKGDETWITIV